MITKEMLEDKSFDMRAYILGEIQETIRGFFEEEERRIIYGTGKGEPIGFLNIENDYLLYDNCAYGL